MKKLLFKNIALAALTALLSITFIPTQAIATPSYIVVGYAPGYNSNPSYNFTGNFASAIPWADLSHVNYAFVTISGTTAAMDDGSGVAAAICTQAHAHGVRCYISVGGANPAGQWGSITSTANAQTLANSITSLIHYGGVTFDGVDVDWEFPTSAAVFNALLQQIRTNLNAITPGLAPSGKYAGESAEGLTLYLSPGSSVCGYGFTTSNSIVDWYTDSGYDLNVNVAGDQWNGALTDPSNTQFTNCNSNSMQLSINTVANWYNTVGYGGTIPYNKMVLGMPLYGRNVGGTTTTPDAVQFSSGSGSGYNATAAEEVWSGNSMDTAQSFCDKMNWAIGAKGMKGIAMWDLGQGLPTNANSMMTSIWNVIGGSSSCLTVGGGPGSPTVTPTSTPSCGTLVADFESGSAQDNLGGFTSLSAGGCTVNPTTWAPSSGYGLAGTTYGARFYGTTTGCTYGPSLLVPLGTGATPKYNAQAAGQDAEIFHIKITTGPATPATVIVGVVPTNGTSSGFQYDLVIQPASFGQDLTETVFFSQMAWAYGAVTTLDTTQLYQLYYEPLWAGNYDITIDQIEFTCAPTPTPTPTNTYTATFTNTYTPTKTLTFTNTYTNTPTPTFTTAPATNTFTPTKTNTPTNTFTNSPTPTNSFTNTPIPPTNTFTFTLTKTNTPTNTYTNTPVPPTSTFTSTKTNTPTNTYTNTSVPPTSTFTPTSTQTFTNTSTKTNTPTSTFTNSPTNTNTNTPLASTSTFTNTATKTNTPTSTNTSTFTSTLTYTNTPLFTNTFTNTATKTNTPTSTNTNSFTPTATNTNTPLPTNTFTNTSTKTNTPTATNTNTSTSTATSTNTPLPTSTFTNTFTRTFTSTNTYSPTPTNSFTSTNTRTFTFTSTNTPTLTWTGTPTNTTTGTLSPTNTPTNSLSPTKTSTSTNTSTNTATFTSTSTSTDTPLPTNTFTNTPTKTSTNSFTATSTNTNTPLPTNTFTLTSTKTNTSTNTTSPTATNSFTPANTSTFTPTRTFTSTFTNTGTPTNTFTGTVSPTNTPTNSLTPTKTSTPTSTSTNTSTSTSTSTSTYTPLNTATSSFTPTSTNSFTATSTNSFTHTMTSTNSPTNTATPTNSFTPTDTFTGTLSPTATSTNSFTPTNTATWTLTGTSTNTPTSTSTSTFTNTATKTDTATPTSTSTNSATTTFTPTPTSTPTFTFTSTASFTATATFTATQPVVQVGNGANSPGNQTVPAGASNQVVLQLSVDNTSGENLKLNSLTLTFTGTGNDVSGISSITLWKDPSGSGTISGSSVLATVVSPFASGPSAVVNFSDIVAAGATQDYLVTYTFSSSAPAGTYSVSVSTGAALSGQGITSGKSLQVQGAPVNGAVFTINAVTATPTFTSTVTSSFTPTLSATATLTRTPTPVVRVILGNPYPNPVSGTGVVSIDVTTPAASNLSWAVFTTSFRKVWDDSIPVPAGKTTIQWNLRDKNGVPVSDGLYYIRIQVSGLNSTTHIFKVLVLQ